MLGQEVQTLVDKMHEAGYYSVSWNGKDNKGFDVANGVYMYKIEAGKYTAMKKMSLIR